MRRVATTIALAAAGAFAATAHGAGDRVRVEPVSAPGPGSYDARFGDASLDASRVFFTTAEPLLREDADTARDVYERRAGALRLVTAATEGDFRAIDGDGERVIVQSGDGGIHAIDADGSVASAPVSGRTSQVGTTADGETVIFSGPSGHGGSDANCADRSSEAYAWRVEDGSVELLSKSDNADPGCRYSAAVLGFSRSGDRVLFMTAEPMTGADTDRSSDLYVRAGGRTMLVSGGGGEVQPDYRAITPDGRHVFWETTESLVGADADGGGGDVYGWSDGQVYLVSGGAGGPGTYAQFGGVSDDGARVFFSSTDPLVASDQDGGRRDVYEYAAGAVKLVSGGGNGAFDVRFGGASRDGAHVFFETAEALVGADTDSQSDVYASSGGAPTLVSTGSDTDELGARFVGASADGRRAFFESNYTVYQRRDGASTPVAGVPASSVKEISADGRHVFFETQSRLVRDDNDGISVDVYAAHISDAKTLTAAGSVVRERLRRALRDGLKTRWTVSEPLNVTFRVEIPGPAAKRAGLQITGLRPAVVGYSHALWFEHGTHTIRIRFTRRAARGMRRLRAVRVKVKAVLRDDVGNRGSATALRRLRR